MCNSSGGRCETCLCGIKPMRSFLKHFCMALIRYGDIMQIPANVPRIRDEHHSLSPSPWSHRDHDGKTAEQNQMNEAREHFGASRREQESKTIWSNDWWNFKGHSETMALYTHFLHITFNCFYCCFYGNGRTLWSHYRFPFSAQGRRNWCHATEVNKL